VNTSARPLHPAGRTKCRSPESCRGNTRPRSRPHYWKAMFFSAHVPRTAAAGRAGTCGRDEEVQRVDHVQQRGHFEEPEPIVPIVASRRSPHESQLTTTRRRPARRRRAEAANSRGTGRQQGVRQRDVTSTPPCEATRSEARREAAMSMAGSGILEGLPSRMLAAMPPARPACWKNIR